MKAHEPARYEELTFGPNPLQLLHDRTQPALSHTEKSQPAASLAFIHNLPMCPATLRRAWNRVCVRSGSEDKQQVFGFRLEGGLGHGSGPRCSNDTFRHFCPVGFTLGSGFLSLVLIGPTRTTDDTDLKLWL